MIIKRHEKFDLLMPLLEFADQQLLHEVLLIQDKEDGTTILHNLMEGYNQNKDTDHIKLERILDFLNPELLLKQLTVESQGGFIAVQHALINKDKKIIDILCNKLSNHQELLEKNIRHLNADDQPLADVDKELWLKNIKSLHDIIHNTSKKPIEQLISNVFLVQNDLGETLFSRLSKRYITLETVEQLLENRNSELPEFNEDNDNISGYSKYGL